MNDDSDQGKHRKDLPIVGDGDKCDCNSSDCCSAPSTDSGSYKGVKTAVFLIVMLAAVAVGAYSLVGNHTADDATIASLDDGLAVDPLALDKLNLAADILEGNDFACLILFGAGAAVDENKRVAKVADDAAILIRNKGVSVKTENVAPGDPAFGRVVDLFDVGGLPAVLAVKKDGGSILIDSNITENSLLTVYLTGCDPSAGCAPGCDPKDCGN